ncbi:NAD(P)H-dependent glycerol-3-phosphate dehydrogenase [Galactobacter sp.]|uniref:NAD(P)H-dependent glycerol-3-phosphate dehydrogenase n=1 Tax=Galactobacter sp. TaxID=2676125 RepID=UPI0025BF2168|nr:NAD(P)H-dependent glycerol-3-phosphate dehydrogenase [Galactobacter sp.]
MLSAPNRIAVMGSGSWGTTFAKVLADSDPSVPVVLWARRDAVVQEINEHHTNSTYLGDTALPANISATVNPREALKGASLVILAVPAQSLRSQLEAWGEAISPDAVVVSLMKGLERGTDLRMSQVVTEVAGVPSERVLVLSGPNLAREIARNEPTASVVAGDDEEVAAWVAQACSPGYFRPYTNTDLIGVELGGLVKNVIALAVGICDGLGMGDNTKATVITRGLAETTRLVLAMGGKAETMAGLAGMGDLVATCSSPLSRNHTAGRLIGEGNTLEEVGQLMTQTAEGIKSGAAVAHLAAAHGVEMPITEAVVAVVEGKAPVSDMARKLLDRELKSEEKRR